MLYSASSSKLTVVPEVVPSKGKTKNVECTYVYLVLEPSGRNIEEKLN